MKDSYGREWSLGFENFDRGVMYANSCASNASWTKSTTEVKNASDYAGGVCTLDSLDNNDTFINLRDGTSLLTNFSNGSITCEKPVISLNPAKKLHFRARDIKLSLDGLMRV